MRRTELNRTTKETDISCILTLEGSGIYQIETGCGYLNHMLELFTRHGRFDLTLYCKGDTHVDDHHTVEDVGIVLGRSFANALGDCVGITRYGTMTLAMDETLILASLDISGRVGLFSNLQFYTEKIGTFDTQLINEFYEAFVRGLSCTLHLQQLAGKNSHHIAEASFKAFARALRDGVAIDSSAPNQIPSTKGTIL